MPSVNAAPSRVVCIIGAQGALGTTAAAHFESAGWSVHRAGRRAERSEGFRLLDLDQSETVAPALRGADLIVSTVPHSAWMAERAVLERGGVLVGCSHAPGRVAAMISAEANEEKGTVLINAGLVPGVTNLVAAELLAEHPQADRFEIAFTVHSAGTAGKAGGEFVHHGLTSRRHHRAVALPMPHPFGRLSFIEVAEREDGGFGGVAEKCEVETCLGFCERRMDLPLRTVNALRLSLFLPRPVFMVKRGRDTAARVFGEALLEADRSGCFNPEDIFTLDDLLPVLGDVGLRVTREWDGDV